MGIRVTVYRSPYGDSSNGGPSSRVAEFTVVNCDGPFEPDAKSPAAVLQVGPNNSIRLVPQSVLDSKKWYMFSGNYAGASDSRFTRAIEKLLGQSFYGAVAIHDRVE